jgi:hypothetical protein
MGERSDQRIEAALGVVVRYGGVSEACLSRTVSRRGIAVASQRSWPVGTEIELEIVHQGLRLRTLARVVGLRPNGMGLEFVRPGPEFESALGALLATLVGGGHPTRAEPPEGMREVAWSVAEAGKGLGGLIRGRQHKARLLDLSLDGASIAWKNPPEVGTEILIHLPNHAVQNGNESTVQCVARVVRHTERGFAVQFQSPSTVFRRVISEIRKAARGGPARDA